MQSPIPEPNGHIDRNASKVELIRGPRPVALNYLIGVDVLLTVAGYILNPQVEMPWYLGAAIQCLFFLITYRLWTGQNWARIFNLVMAVLSVLALFAIAGQKPMDQVFTVTYAVMGIIWFWFLLTPAMVAFTKGLPASEAP
jgi:hypothetical protein